MNVLLLLLGSISAFTGIRGESVDLEDEYPDYPAIDATTPVDISDDFEQYEIIEYEDPPRKSYHCTVKKSTYNATFELDSNAMKTLDKNGILSIYPGRLDYQRAKQIRQRLCRFGFDPFLPDMDRGSVHKRFKNRLRLMVYNTPSILPNLRVIRNDLDRKRRREPQVWWRFDLVDHASLDAEFDYDNYFVTITGDLSHVRAFSRLLVALKLHKRLNNFNDSVTRKVNLDLGVAEVILSSFGITMMREKSVAALMVKALNGIRTEANEADVQLEFEDSVKEAADQVDPLLYSYIWLLAMAEKYEVVEIKASRTGAAAAAATATDAADTADVASSYRISKPSARA